MDTPRAKRCRGGVAADAVGRAGESAGRGARAARAARAAASAPRRRQQQQPAATKLKSRLRLRIPAVPLSGRPRRRRRRQDAHRDDALQQDPLQDLHPTWSWGSGRLRRRQRHRQLLRPHSIGSTGSTASSSSSIASASSFASTSSCSWSSTSPEPPQLSSASCDLSAMARPPVTRRTARIARELYSAWSGRVGASAYIPSEKVQQLFNDLQLYPSKLEVVEMLRCAQQRAQRTEPAILTYEEFSAFAKDLKDLKRAAKGISWQSPYSQLDRDVEDSKRSRTRRKASTRSPQVFLGGSCNPTTWRQDDAIPLLKDLDISFYNPQVSDWAPELIEKEHFAKKNAEVLLFVIDKQTRNTATMVEIAFYSGLKEQKMVLVVHPYQSSGTKIGGEEILDDELRDLITGQQVMQLLAERQGVPVFSSIRLAVDSIDKVLREKIPIQELQSGKKCLPQINEPAGVLEKEAKENVPISQYQSTVDPKSNQDSRNISSTRPFKPSSSNQQPSFDVYLCGDEVAVPHLKKHGLKYVIPSCNQTDWTKQMLQSNVAIADRSRVLLFVITDSSRSLAELCLASYYIGLGYKVVLHVSLLTEESIINGKKLSNTAVKEYNRGRMYLRDLAIRQNVELLDSVSAAVEVAARKSIRTSAAR